MALIRCNKGGSGATSVAYSDTTAAIGTYGAQSVTYNAPAGKTIVGIDSLTTTGSITEASAKVACMSVVNNGSSLVFTCTNFYTTTSQTCTVSCNVLLA